MEALTFCANVTESSFSGDFKYHNKFPKPEVNNPNDVLIEVAYAGICGTDLHIIEGHFPCKTGEPITLGHEFSGRVVQIGSAVTNVQVGQLVSIDPNDGCHVCSNCRHGNVHFCQTGSLCSTIGIFRNGGFAQFALVPDVQVHRLPDGVGLKEGALSEPLSCIVHGWDKLQPIAIGKRILIMGAGIIGNLWLACLSLQGHCNITVSEVNPARLAHIRQHFNCDCVTPDVITKRASDKNEDFMYDFVIDCTGNANAIQGAVGAMKSGGVMCVFGVASPEARICISPYELFAKELTIFGVRINPFTFPNALGLLDSLVKHDFLDFSKLGIKVFKLCDYEKAIDELRHGSIAKAMFKIN